MLWRIEMSDALSPTAVFLLQLVVIIGLARGLGLLARRVHQPLVVAEIAAGIILGPSVLGAFAPETMRALFPESSMSTLQAMSELGLVLFMFLVGLELDARHLRLQFRTAARVAFAGVFVPFLAVGAIAPWLHRELSDSEIPLLPFALFVGTALSITALPALARILTERHLVGTKIGAIALAAAAIDDVTAWCVLAAVISLMRAREATLGLATASLVVVVCAAMVLLVRPLLGRLAARVEHGSGLTENVVAGVLLALFVASLVTEGIGIHALFGAFLFGAVFPRRGGVARALAQRVEDVTTTVLLPIFFAYSGLRTQIGLLDSPREWALCGAVILLAIVGKAGGSLIALRRSNVDLRESLAIATLMSTRGPMELVVLHVGLGLGVLSPALFTMFVLMALVTTAAASPILRLLVPSDMILRRDSEQSPAPTSNLPTALVCVAEPESGPALAVVSRALSANTSESIFAVHMVPASDRPSSRLDSDDGSSVLEPLIEEARSLGLSVRHLSFVSGDVGPDICATAEVKQASWVVLGGSDKLELHGGTVGHVLRHASPAVAVLVGRNLASLDRLFVCANAKQGLSVRLARRVARSTSRSSRSSEPLTFPSVRAATCWWSISKVIASLPYRQISRRR